MKFIPLIALSLMFSNAVSAVNVAFAAPPLNTPPLSSPPLDTTPSAPSIEDALKDFKLPSQAEIDEMLAQMPDFNAIMGDVMVVMKDEKLRTKMKSSAEAFKDKIEESDILTQRDANGLPDIKALMSVMLGTMSDEGVAGEFLEGMAEFASEMDAIAEKHDLKSSPKTPTHPKP